MPEMWPRLIENAVRYYFLELVDINQKCPFLDDKGDCAIYAVRPYTCRIYGLLSPRQDNPARRQMMEKIAEQYRQEHDLELPREIVEFEFPQCDRVQVVGGARKKPSELVQLLAVDLGRLETFFVPPEAVEKQYTFAPYVNHLVTSIVSEGARYRRPRVMKEFLTTGHSQLLDDYLEKYKKVAF